MGNEVRLNPEDPSVIPIVMPKVNWGLLLPALQCIGMPRVTRLLDANEVNQDDLPALTLVLSQIFSNESSMVDAIRNAGQFLRHTHVSFLVHAEEKILSEIMMQIDLKTSSKDQIAIISGTLNKWRAACVEGTNIKRSKDCRKIFNKIIAWFGQGALVHLFWGYKKINNVDKTFSLALG